MIKMYVLWSMSDGSEDLTPCYGVYCVVLLHVVPAEAQNTTIVRNVDSSSECGHS